MKTVFLTGATGHIGRVVLESLVEEGFRVRALVRTASPCLDCACAGVEVVRGDLRDPGSYQASLGGCDAVVHAAAGVSNAASYKQLHPINAIASRALAVNATRAGVPRLVYLSTVGVYGPGSLVDAPESTPVSPRSAYERTKAEAETDLLSFDRRGDVSVCALRLPAVLGPYDRKILPGIVGLLRARRFAFIGSGENYFDVISARDAARAVVLALEREQARGPFNVSCGSKRTFREVVGLIAEAFRVPTASRSLPVAAAYVVGAAADAFHSVVPRRSEFSPSRYSVEFFKNHHNYAIDQATRVLGYRPEAGLERSLSEIAQRWVEPAATR